MLLKQINNSFIQLVINLRIIKNIQNLILLIRSNNLDIARNNITILQNLANHIKNTIININNIILRILINQEIIINKQTTRIINIINMNIKIISTIIIKNPISLIITQRTIKSLSNLVRNQNIIQIRNITIFTTNILQNRIIRILLMSQNTHQLCSNRTSKRLKRNIVNIIKSNWNCINKHTSCMFFLKIRTV